jgi:hypothetical protein
VATENLIEYMPLPGKGLVIPIQTGIANVPVSFQIRMKKGQRFASSLALGNVAFYDLADDLIATIPIGFSNIDRSLAPRPVFGVVWRVTMDVSRFTVTSSVANNRIAFWFVDQITR